MAGCPATGWISFGAAALTLGTFTGYSVSVNKDKPDTAESDAGPQARTTTCKSDPAKGADDGADWSDEGGATPSGPADTGDHTQ